MPSYDACRRHRHQQIISANVPTLACTTLPAQTHLTFSPEFTKAVEAKQVAQQDAQRATFIVERAKQEREGIIIRAEGEAQSARMVGEAIRSNPGFLQLRRLEAAREIAQTLRTSNNRVFLSADTLMVNVNDDSYGPGAPGDGVSAVARTHGTPGCVAVAVFHVGRSTRWESRRRASKDPPTQISTLQ